MKKTEINGCTVLTADEGMRIVKNDGFVCGTVVWLAVNDVAENYTEITEEEAEELDKARHEAEDDYTKGYPANPEL